MMGCIDIGQWIALAFIATVVFTVLESGSQAVRLTRMSMPYLLGSTLSPSRDRARALGIGMHLAMGQAMALAYLWIFHVVRSGTVRTGLLLGTMHGLFMVLVAIPAMPAWHPRMASDEQGPTATRQLEPPGRLALNYGWGTPVSILLSHMAFGALLGALYRMPVGC